MTDAKLLDCTLRDGGYYNQWNFPRELVDLYLNAMAASGVTYVEMGLRTLKVGGFKGAYAYTTDQFLRSLDAPNTLTLGVMVNAAEWEKEGPTDSLLKRLFPENASNSPIDLVRVACHVHEFSRALPASAWLKDRGYHVGFNLMQIAGRSTTDVAKLAAEAEKWPIDVLYFADSLGGMAPTDVEAMVEALRNGWSGALGIHTHDNLGLALSNTLRAESLGVDWLDATVTGMGRGPGNAKTEHLVLELAEMRDSTINVLPLTKLIRNHFRPMQIEHGWGTNFFYYLSGKYGIHPSYVQAMLKDSRYEEEDILAVLEQLKNDGGSRYSASALDTARSFFEGEPSGTWDPKEAFKGVEVLIIGAGPGVSEHQDALESFVRRKKPIVVALNAQNGLDSTLIDYRAACHPLRLLADWTSRESKAQPLIAPASMLPQRIREHLGSRSFRDFGIAVRPGEFDFHRHHCVLPRSLVVGYALAAAACGEAERVYLAGFDGYGADDPRTTEMRELIELYTAKGDVPELISLTPTQYPIAIQSVYAF